jgi:hypothetical protein
MNLAPAISQYNDTQSHGHLTKSTAEINWIGDSVKHWATAV